MDYCSWLGFIGIGGVDGEVTLININSQIII